MKTHSLLMMKLKKRWRKLLTLEGCVLCRFAICMLYDVILLQFEDTVSDDERNDDEDVSGIASAFSEGSTFCLLNIDELKRAYVDEQTGEAAPSLR